MKPYLFFCRMIVGACELGNRTGKDGRHRSSISAIRLHRLGGYSKSLSRLRVSPSNRVYRSSARTQSPTRPPTIYITSRPSLRQKSFLCTLLSLACQTSSPPRLTRAPLRPSVPSRRMLSERQTRVIQVSFCNIFNRWRC